MFGRLTNTEVLATCPSGLIYSIEMQDTSTPDPTVFTLTTNTLTIETNDLAKIGTYYLRLFVQFSGASYSTNGSYDF